MSVNRPNITNNPFQSAAGSAMTNNSQIANKDKVKQISQEQKDKFDNLPNSLQEQGDMAKSAAKTAVIGILMSLITKFINTDKIIDAVISNLIKKTKKKLNNKGRVEVKNKSIVIFYPKFSGDFSPYKKEFEIKKVKLLKTIKILKTIIDSISVVLKLIKTALVILQIQLQIKKKKLLITAASSAPDLASPSPAKPVAAQYPINKELNDQVFKQLEDKINNYVLLITFIQPTIQTLQQILTRSKIKVDRLSFNINVDPTTTPILNQEPSLVSDEEPTSTLYNNGVKDYIIEVITTPSGALQAVAFDAFSKLKITQTAPSKTREADELIEELKQILG
jgi:hypothetical protein